MTAFIKRISFLLTGIACCLIVSGQKRTLPAEGSVMLLSNEEGTFPRQSGKLEIVRDNTGKAIFYKTDSSEMYSTGLTGFLPDENGNNVSEYDSVVAGLFRNGLLTSDLLITALNAERKLVDHKGDTQDISIHVNKRRVCLHTIRKIKIPKSYKGKSTDLLFEVSISFDPPAGASALDVLRLYTIYDLELYLRGDHKPSAANFADYLKTAIIKHLRFEGIQI